MAYFKKSSWRERKFLQSLDTGSPASIEHKETPDNDAVLVDANFPKNIVNYFAPDLVSTTVSNPTSSVNQVIITEVYTVVGGRTDDVKAIFAWMRSCCAGEGLIIWPRYQWTDFAFNKLWHLRTASQAITCRYLEDEFQYRMQLLSGHHIHAGDLELTYNEAGRGSEMGDFLVAHVASAILGRVVADKGLEAYAAIRERNEAFDEQLDDMIGLRLAFRAKIKGEEVYEPRKKKKNRPKKKGGPNEDADASLEGGNDDDTVATAAAPLVVAED